MTLKPGTEEFSKEVRKHAEMNTCSMPMYFVRMDNEECLYIAGARLVLGTTEPFIRALSFTKFMMNLYHIMVNFAVTDHFPFEMVVKYLPIVQQLLDKKAKFLYSQGTRWGAAKRVTFVYENNEGDMASEVEDVEPTQHDSRKEAIAVWKAALNNPHPGFVRYETTMPRNHVCEVRCEHFEFVFPTKTKRFLGMNADTLHGSCKKKNCNVPMLFGNEYYRKIMCNWITKMQSEDSISLSPCPSGCPLDEEEMLPMCDDFDEIEEECPEVRLVDVAEAMIEMDPSQPTVEFYESSLGKLTQVVATFDSPPNVFSGISESKETAEAIVYEKITRFYSGNVDVTPGNVVKTSLKLVKAKFEPSKERMRIDYGSSALNIENDKVLLISERGKPFNLPGGKNNGHETHLETMCREWGEEVGDAPQFCFQFNSLGNAVYSMTSFLNHLPKDRNLYRCNLRALPVRIFPWVYRVLYRHFKGSEWPQQVNALIQDYQDKVKDGGVEGPLVIYGTPQFVLRKHLEIDDLSEITKGATRYRIIFNRIKNPHFTTEINIKFEIEERPTLIFEGKFAGIRRVAQYADTSEEDIRPDLCDEEGEVRLNDEEDMTQPSEEYSMYVHTMDVGELPVLTDD